MSLAPYVQTPKVGAVFTLILRRLLTELADKFVYELQFFPSTFGADIRK